MTAFANPVPGRILANKAPWPGPPTFRVTATFAQHVASGRAAGIDIGNGRCGAPVLAMDAGLVTFAAAIGAANVVRYRVSASEEFGAAHLATITVKLGQKVARGQQIGTLGMTGADACHLHQGYKVNGVERDWWPLLEQNQLPDAGMGDDVNLKGKVVGWIANRTTKITQGCPFVADPTVMPYNNLAAFGIGQAFTPSVEVIGNSLLGSDHWYGGWITGSPPKFGYAPVAACGPLTPLEAGAGYSQAELDAAVDKAELEAGKEAAVNVAAASVAEAKKYGGT